MGFIENKRTPSFFAASRKRESLQKIDDFVDEKFFVFREKLEKKGHVFARETALSP